MAKGAVMKKGGSFGKKPQAVSQKKKPSSKPAGKPGLDGTEEFLHELDHCE